MSESGRYSTRWLRVLHVGPHVPRYARSRWIGVLHVGPHVPRVLTENQVGLIGVFLCGPHDQNVMDVYLDG